MPSGDELKGHLSLDLCSIGFLSEPGVILLRCAFVLLYAWLLARTTLMLLGVSLCSVVDVLIFLCVWDQRCACLCMSISGCKRVFMDTIACGQKTLSSLVYRQGMSQSVDGLLQSCCPLVCEGFIIELAQALWPNAGDTLSYRTTLLAHYMWKEVRKNFRIAQKMCVVNKNGLDMGWHFF